MDKEKCKSTEKDCYKVALRFNQFIFLFFIFVFVIKLATNSSNDMFSAQLGVVSIFYAIESIYLIINRKITERIDHKKIETNKNNILGNKIGKDFNLIVNISSWLAGFMTLMYFIWFIFIDFIQEKYNFLLEMSYYETICFLSILELFKELILIVIGFLVFLIVLFIRSKYEYKIITILNISVAIIVPFFIAFFFNVNGFDSNTIDFIGILCCFLPSILSLKDSIKKTS